ncbi:UNVERIFIED_CONTAM: hypothetical protein PYX00_010637 [Menopon gallinae]|uniref:Ima1 N-terminal domain-containing protein n=1 Tax=Menopon gallinae TaxID=328185 RepID=A0AAW2HGL9_9NEOP
MTVEIFFIMNSSTSSESSQAQNDTINISAGSMWLTAFTVTVIYLPFLYKKIRCKFPVTVNCWFCNRNTKVPYDDANCWDCPHCEQYNGFNKDGGYNKVIKAQHSPNQNTLVYNTSVQQSKKASPGREKIASNGFCKLCNINQQLKIKQLASFVPLNEDNYDEEVEQFRNQLEKSYRLCLQCERTLTETLQNQQYNLFKDRLNNQKDKIHLPKSSYDYQLILLKLQGGLCSCLKLISGIISFMMFLSFSTQLENELNVLKTTLPEIFVLDFQSFLEEFINYLTYSYTMKREMISIGLLCYALSSFGRQTRHDHPGLLIFWGILYALSWSNMTGLQVLVSAVCVLLSVLEIKTSPNYTMKRLLRKEPEKMQSERMTENPSEPLDAASSFIVGPKRNEVRPNVNEAEEMMKECHAQEVSEELPKSEPLKLKPPTPPRSEPQMPQLRNRKIFNKNFLASLESERIEKELSPPPEIFQNLNNLHIGNNFVAPDKQSNFLFENHNFEERCKKTSPLIKPPKFIKTSSSSWTAGELNETISRSSTPSSGYSSQKLDKPETRQSVLFPKALSPISCGRTTPPDNFDYWDRSHPYFNSSNIHYCNPGYMPFQQFPNPMGPTTVYTYTRPANFPLSSFTPSPTSPNYPYATGSRSSRFSDASENQNLFQNVSQTLQSNRKWATIKSILYNVSIFLNIVTTCVLGYFTWSGIISLTGN